MNYTQNNIFYSIIAICTIVASLSMSGCSHRPRIYKLDIEQGNKLTTESVNQVKIGMTQEEVNNILGTPALNAIFQKNRWYYVYRNQPGYGKLQKHHLIIFFTDGVVSGISGDYNEV